MVIIRAFSRILNLEKDCIYIEKFLGLHYLQIGIPLF